MKREIQITNFASNYSKSCYPNDDYVSYAARGDIAQACIDAINWADEHPRKGLVDIDKVCKWLEKGGYFVNNTETIEDFRNAMMNENTSIIDEEKIMEDLVKFKHGN